MTQTRSAMVNFIYDGEHLRFNNKWKELHLKPFFLKEGTDLREHISEVKWKEHDPLAKLVKNSFGQTLTVRREAERQAESLLDKYPEPKIDALLREREKKLLREIEEKEKLGR